MLLWYKWIPKQSFVMLDDATGCIYSTYHYEVCFKVSSWFGLVNKVVTEKTSWNATDKEAIERQLDQKIGNWIKS